MQFTKAQNTAIINIYNKYKHVEGDYASTMLYGIISGCCDSGILTDALSVDDAILLKKHNLLKIAVDEGLYEANEKVFALTNKDLLCCTVIDELASVYNDVEETARQMYKLGDF